jgi:flagellar hook-length control protein FliK
MDIKTLSEFLTGKPAVTETGDLLAQLKAAGTVEAEVIKVLQGKLLLSSRLGEILTTNTLNYKPGDKINLRLSGDEQNPVLKASPRIPSPVTLDSGQNPRLSRALPPDRSVLAVVSRITAQRIEIRLAGQILTLPRQPGVARNQLLSLQRNDARRSIEIIPLDRKLIYKGLLKQLVPDQPKSSSTSLVRLLELVNKAVDAAQPKAAPTLDSSRQSPARAIANKLQLPASQPATIQPKPRPAPLADKPQITSKADIQAPLPVAKAPGLSSLKTPASNEVTPPQNNRLLGTLLRQVNKADARPGAPVNLVKPAASRSGSAPHTATSKPSVAAQKLPLPGIGKISSGAANGNQIAANTVDRANPGPPNQPRPTLPNHHIGPAHGNAPREMNSTQPPPQASVTPTLLQILLQMVSKVPDIDATRIKQWFEFSSLIHSPKANSSGATSTDPLKTLKQLVDKTAFSRDLDLTLQPRTRSPAADDAPTAKTMPQEILLAHARDGIKLVEQAMSHNLLQRASLGMQQETQQPLSLSFALPFLDQHEVKPLYIDLEQRDQPQEEIEKSWDIRLRFELADLGPLSCHIFLQGMTVAASFYCENSQTRIRVEQALPELKQQLSGAGFNAGELHSFPGKPGQPQTSTTTSYPESLIDIEV